jgi:hypothetical protein
MRFAIILSKLVKKMFAPPSEDHPDAASNAQKTFLWIMLCIPFTLAPSPASAINPQMGEICEIFALARRDTLLPIRPMPTRSYPKTELLA